MWRLLPLCLLVACAGTDPKESTRNSGTAAQAQIVRTVELPLAPPSTTIAGQPSNKVFQATGTSGWVDSTGVWQIRSEVSHSRLRCGVYEIGMQLGRGSPRCSAVRWVTEPAASPGQQRAKSKPSSPHRSPRSNALSLTTGTS